MTPLVLSRISRPQIAPDAGFSTARILLARAGPTSLLLQLNDLDGHLRRCAHGRLSHRPQHSANLARTLQEEHFTCVLTVLHFAKNLYEEKPWQTAARQKTATGCSTRGTSFTSLSSCYGSHIRGAKFSNLGISAHGRGAAGLRRRLGPALHDRLVHGREGAMASGCSVTQSLSHSVTQSLSHSVTQSLSHSVTQSLARSLARSLTHSLTGAIPPEGGIGGAAHSEV